MQQLKWVSSSLQQKRVIGEQRWHPIDQPGGHWAHTQHGELPPILNPLKGQTPWAQQGISTPIIVQTVPRFNNTKCFGGGIKPKR